MVATARTDSERGKPQEVGYFALIRELPLRPIRTEVELDRAIAMVNALGDRERSLLTSTTTCWSCPD